MSAPFVDPRQQGNVPVVDPTQQNPLAKLLSEALGQAGGAIKGDLQTFGNRTAESGLPTALAQGFNDIPQALLGLLSNLPGAQESSRLGIQALAGQRGVDALFGGGQGQGQTLDPQLAQALGAQGPGTQVQDPQAGPPPQGPATTPFQPIQAPQLPDPQFGAQPDFSGARGALGSAVPAQQIGGAEKLSRGFGGLAGGGLEAIQGAPPGRAATTGEVIAGVGAGGAVALARLGAEDRQLKAFADASEQMRRKQLSNIELAESASIAEKSESDAATWNAQHAQQMQLDMTAQLANLQASRLQPVANGFIDPTTGEFTSTNRTTLVETIQGLLMVDKIEKIPLQRTASVFGQEVMLTTISAPMQVPVMAALQALSTPNAVEVFIETLREQGKEDLASELDRIKAGGLGVDDDTAARTAGIAVTEMAQMIFQDLMNPENPPFGFAADFIPLALTLGGIQTTDQVNQVLQSLGGP